MIRKVLIANRGEIALRILRACRDLGLRTVAVHSTVDTEALHVRFADEAVCIGPPAPRLSYLHIPALIAAAEITGADAIHPGYGFLSESAEFAEVCRRCRLTFIGPSPESMRQWGDKVRAREMARRFGLPLLPGSGVLRDAAEAVEAARTVGFPVMLKAAGGGGGRGMKVVRDAAALPAAFHAAQQEALAGFGNGDIFLERFVEAPRHIEFQVVADQHGNAVCLGERDCTVQRRHQKLHRGVTQPALRPTRCARPVSERIVRAMRESGYTSLGTLEFMLDPKGELYFLEMNTRVQVEHTGDGDGDGARPRGRADPHRRGARLGVPARAHAARARDRVPHQRGRPVTFAPVPGAHHGVPPARRVGRARRWRGLRRLARAAALRLAAGEGDRARAHADGAIARMQRALGEFIVGGIATNLSLHRRVLAHPDFQSAQFSTRFLDTLGPVDGPGCEA
jgi:acetyl-CoA carboxylase biotin carboxylase subunit